jgi:hypothetical protein
MAACEPRNWGDICQWAGYKYCLTCGDYGNTVQGTGSVTEDHPEILELSNDYTWEVNDVINIYWADGWVQDVTITAISEGKITISSSAVPYGVTILALELYADYPHPQGSKKGYCTSIWAGDDIPKWIALTITGSTTLTSCWDGPDGAWCAPCLWLIQKNDNTFSGTVVLELTNTFKLDEPSCSQWWYPQDCMADGCDTWSNAAGYSIKRYYNPASEKYIVSVDEPSDGVGGPVGWKEYDTLPSMLSAITDLAPVWAKQYRMTNQGGLTCNPCNGGSPCIYNDPGTYSWSVFSCSVCPDATTPIYGDYTTCTTPPKSTADWCYEQAGCTDEGEYYADCVADVNSCGIYPYSGQTIPWPWLKSTQAFNIRPIRMPDVESCFKTGACVQDYIIGSTLETSGDCCIEVTFSGITVPTTMYCYHSGVEGTSDAATLANVKIKYRYAGAAAGDGWRFEALPWGCTSIFPTTLQIIHSQDSAYYTGHDEDADFYCTRHNYTFYLSGSDTICGGDNVWADRTVNLVSDPLHILEDGPKITEQKLDGYTLSFTEGENYAVGYSVDWSNSTASVDLAGDSHGACRDTIGHNPFYYTDDYDVIHAVDKWTFECSPAFGQYMVYDSINYEYDDVEEVTTMVEDRVITIQADGKTWIMDDKYGGHTPITYEFESGGGVGSGHMAVYLGATDETTIENIETAINNVADTTLSVIRAWNLWPSGVFSESVYAALLATIDSVNVEAYKWVPPVPAKGSLLLVVLANVGEATPQLLPGGSMALGSRWFKHDIVMTYDGSETTLDDGIFLTLDDGENEPIIFEFDTDSSTTGVSVTLSKTALNTMANLVAAINAQYAAENLLIRAVASDPADENCELWQLIDDVDTKVGTITMTPDWFTFNDTTGVMTVVFDILGSPGQYWWVNNKPVGLVAWTKTNRPNAWYLEIVDDVCTKGGTPISFCYPGGQGTTPTVFKCRMADPSERCGYKNATDYKLTAHWDTR